MKQQRLLLVLLLSLAASPVQAKTVLTLKQALEQANAHHPRMLAATASVQVAQARKEQAFAPMLPQVNLSSSYNQNNNQSSGNALSLRASQVLYDFGQRGNQWKAAEAQLSAEQQSAEDVQQQVLLNVRTAYYTVQASQALVQVNQAAVSNQQRHVQQTKAFVTAGSRPPIDLVQAQKNLANAQLQLINAQNNYQINKAQLNQAMGLERNTEYEVASDAALALSQEGLSVDELYKIAANHRPDIMASQGQVKSQELSLAAQNSALAPVLQASVGVADAGLLRGQSGTNLDAGISLSWSLFNGGSNRAQVAQAEAQLASIKAQSQELNQRVRYEITQARLAIESEKAAIKAAQESVKYAKEQLKLAEGRYNAGVGNLLEVDDAQYSLTSAESQLVQENFKLSTARAQLLKALGLGK